MSSTRPSARDLWARVTMKATCLTRGILPAAVFSRAIVTRTGSRRWRCAIAAMRGRHGRREERRLPLRRRGGEDRLDVLGEAHVEHLVRLVEDEDAHRVELQRAPLQVVERAAGGRHHDVDAALQGADLLVHRRAAVERHDAEVEPLRVLVDRPPPPAWPARAWGRGRGRSSGRGAPRRPPRSAGAAAARRRRSCPVPVAAWPSTSCPARRTRDGLALDRGRLLVPEGGRGGHERLGQAEGREVGGRGVLRCFRHAGWYRAAA